MSKHEKLLHKLCADPPSTDITWSKLVHVMKGFGYVVINGSGSRRKFFNQSRGLIINCHEPHPSSIVKAYCIKDVVRHLTENQIIKNKG